MNREILISYAYAFISYLFRDTNISEGDIKSVYLFGSVARGDFDKESDIDIFINTESKEIKKIIDRSFEKFANSEENKKFRLMGIGNEIKVIHGNIEEWELKESVEKDGLLLYSSSIYGRGLKSFFLVSIEPIKDITKRNRVMRRLVGRKEKYYKGGGLVKEIGGEALDTRTFLVRSDKVNKVLELFSKEGVKYRAKKLWM